MLQNAKIMVHFLSFVLQKIFLIFKQANVQEKFHGVSEAFFDRATLLAHLQIFLFQEISSAGDSFKIQQKMQK